MSEGRGGEMKYQIIKTDLQINNKLYSEGSEVELSKDQIKGIEDYLIPIDSHPELTEGHSALDAESKENKVKKTKTKTNKGKK